jgi:hypothetical protein
LAKSIFGIGSTATLELFGIILNTAAWLDIKKSLLTFYKDLNILKCHTEIKDSSFAITDHSELSNSIKDSLIEDPISLDGIKNEWSHAPRFIKIGPYLFSLDSILKQLFFKPVNQEDISHPIENRLLSTQEQEKLITDLSQLFCLDRTEIIKYWDPYFCDERKLSYLLDPQIIDKSALEKNEIFQDIFLENDLSELIPNWQNFSIAQKASIKSQIRDDFFASQRLQKFLKQFSDEILDIEIKKNDNEFFTLRSMLNSEHQRKFKYNY